MVRQDEMRQALLLFPYDFLSFDRPFVSFYFHFIALKSVRGELDSRNSLRGMVNASPDFSPNLQELIFLAQIFFFLEILTSIKLRGMGTFLGSATCLFELSLDVVSTLNILN